MSPISAIISSSVRRVGERMSAIPSCVAPTLPSGRVLGERSDDDVPSVVEEEVEGNAQSLSCVLIIFSDCFRRAYNGGKTLGTGRDWIRVGEGEGLRRSGETCLSTLFSRALPVTAHLNGKGALRDPRWKNEDRFAHFLAGNEFVSYCKLWGVA